MAFLSKIYNNFRTELAVKKNLIYAQFFVARAIVWILNRGASFNGLKNGDPLANLFMMVLTSSCPIVWQKCIECRAEPSLTWLIVAMCNKRSECACAEAHSTLRQSRAACKKACENYGEQNSAFSMIFQKILVFKSWAGMGSAKRGQIASQKTARPTYYSKIRSTRARVPF